MSWSVFAIGKAPAVAAKLRADFARLKGQCSAHEEMIKAAVEATIYDVLGVMPVNDVITVQANGGSHAPDPTKRGELRNSVLLKIEPMHGFVG